MATPIAPSSRKDLIEALFLNMITQNCLLPPTTLEEACAQWNIDTTAIILAYETRYINGRDHRVPKAGNLHLAWEYLENPQDHGRFTNMLRLPPLSFLTLVELIQDNSVFTSESNTPQAPVKIQLGVTLYRMGQYGNGASIEDVARMAGISKGSVINFTDRCLKAIDDLHTTFVRHLTPEEKEIEKVWVDQHVGFRGLWREGWVMYDGTIVVLHKKPGLMGETYYTRKANYGLNVQVSDFSYIPSVLTIL